MAANQPISTLLCNEFIPSKLRDTANVLMIFSALPASLG